MAITFVNPAPTFNDTNGTNEAIQQEYLVTVGSNQWYVTIATIGSTADFGFKFWKWNGTTWTLVNTFTSYTGAAGSVSASGNLIYFVTKLGGSAALNMYRYDTVGNTVSGPVVGPTGPSIATNGMATFPTSGNILVQYGTNAVVYNTTTQTWGTGHALVNPGIVAIQSSTATAFIFSITTNNGGLGIKMQCQTITESGTVGTAQDVYDWDPTNIGAPGYNISSFGAIGQPVVTNDPSSPHVAIPLGDVLPRANTYATGAYNTLLVARATCATNPTFTIENVQANGTLPAGMIFAVQNVGNGTPFGWTCTDQGDGNLYAFASVIPGNTSTGDSQSASSHQQLYQYVSTAPNTWAAGIVSYDSGTGAHGFEGLGPISTVVDANGKVAIEICLTDQTNWYLGAANQIAGPHVYLYQAAAPPPPPAPSPTQSPQITTNKSGIRQKLITIPEMNSFDEVRQVMAKVLADLQTHIATQLPVIDQRGLRLSNVASPIAADDVVTVRYLQSLGTPPSSK